MSEKQSNSINVSTTNKTSNKLNWAGGPSQYKEIGVASGNPGGKHQRMKVSNRPFDVFKFRVK